MLTTPFKQQTRRYATETGSSGGSKSVFFVAGGAGLAAATYWYLSGTPASQIIESKVKEVKGMAGGAKPALTGGDQGFVSLKLSEVENVNSNTKRFRFELPEPDMISGMNVASALVTKYKGPNDEKPTIRPYTPVSDEGRLLPEKAISRPCCVNPSANKYNFYR